VPARGLLHPPFHLIESLPALAAFCEVVVAGPETAQPIEAFAERHGFGHEVLQADVKSLAAQTAVIAEPVQVETWRPPDCAQRFNASRPCRQATQAGSFQFFAGKQVGSMFRQSARAPLVS
jgi:hypothetical protein